MKTRLAAVTAVLLLALTGCAGNPESAGDERQTAATSESSQSESSASAAPLTEEEQFFVDNETWSEFDLSDAELLEAAQLACDEFAAGKTGDDMTLPGIPQELTRYFANGAREQFCPSPAS